jgi:transcription initiation factor IIE alpha subunit
MPPLPRFNARSSQYFYEEHGMQAILDYLKLGGDRLDTEIAAATGMSLDSVRTGVSSLQKRGEVMVCRSIRYKDGQEVDSMLCRISGYVPPKAPGRKPSR